MPALNQKIRANLVANYTPVLIIPGDMVLRALEILKNGGLENQVEVFALEMFLTQNILEMADFAGVNHAEMLEKVLFIYNERIRETETDQSLRIHFNKGDDLSEDVLSDPGN